MRQIIQEGGEEGGSASDILGFFLFRIFAAMCGVAGGTSLDGSTFMTEKIYRNFEATVKKIEKGSSFRVEVGLDTLMHLMEV